MKLVVDKASLVSVADAIREKGNTTESLEFPNGFVDGINAIESGGGGTEKSIVTVTTSANNTVAVCDVFRTFIDNDKDIVAFQLLRGEETWANNQSLLALLTKSMNIAHLRWNKGSLQNYLGSNYDAVLSVGDEFEMIKIGELWDGV